MSHALVIEHADYVETLVGSGQIFAIRLDDCSANDRADLIDHHTAVMAELRRRGHNVRAGIVRDPVHGFECLRLRIDDGKPASVESMHGL